MSDIATASCGESRRQRYSPSPLLSSFSLPGTLKRSRRCLRVACVAAAAGVTLAGGTAVDSAEREDWNAQRITVDSADCAGWNTQWLWTSASAPDIQACLDGGADPNHRDSYGRTPLHWVAWSEGPPRIWPLPGGDGRFERLIGEWQRVWRGRPAAVAVLLKADADPNARDSEGDTPLHWASMSRPWWAEDPPGLSVYGALLQAGADPNSQNANGISPLHMAVAAGGGLDKVTLLLKAGANLNVPDPYGASPFHRAAERFTSAIISGLLASGADATARDWYDRTPLHLAARENLDPEAIAVLVASGADPHAVDRDGLTPLHYAAWHGPPEVIEALLEAGAAPNAQGKSGNTPLHLAAIDRGVAVIATILKAGADVHVRDAGGDTALHVAAGRNQGDVVLTLLQAGANPGVENGVGETPWHKARTNTFRFLIEGTPAWCWLREGEQC